MRCGCLSIRDRGARRLTRTMERASSSSETALATSSSFSSIGTRRLDAGKVGGAQQDGRMFSWSEGAREERGEGTGIGVVFSRGVADGGVKYSRGDSAVSTMSTSKGSWRVPRPEMLGERSPHLQ